MLSLYRHFDWSEAEWKNHSLTSFKGSNAGDFSTPYGRSK